MVDITISQVVATLNRYQQEFGDLPVAVDIGIRRVPAQAVVRDNGNGNKWVLIVGTGQRP